MNKGRLILTERKGSYVMRRYGYIFLGIVVTSTAWMVVPFSISEGPSFFLHPGAVLFLLFFLAISALPMYIGFQGLRRNRLQIYENGLIPYIKPFRVFWRGEEHFIPWDDVRAVILYDKDYYSPNDFFHFEIYLPGRWGVLINPIVLEGDSKEIFEKMQSLNLEERTNFLNWRDRWKMNLARRMGWLG